MDPGGFADRKGFTRDDLDVERGTELRGGGWYSIALPDRRPDASLLELEQAMSAGDEVATSCTQRAKKYRSLCSMSDTNCVRRSVLRADAKMARGIAISRAICCDQEFKRRLASPAARS